MPRTVRSLLIVWFVSSIAAIAGCGGASGTPDAATGMDAATSDAGRDAGGDDAASTDAASTDAATADAGGDGGATDAGPGDGGPRPDVGPGPDAATCDEDLGAMCEGAPCPTGLECNLGRCVPQARPICGGFAGAPCTDARYPYCLYFASADFGTCVTPAEATCLCARAPSSFTSCP